MLPTPERAGTEGLARAPIIPRPPGAGLGRIAILVGVIPTIRITQPTLVARPFHREGWVYEEKVDGWRMLAYKVAGTVKLVSRNGLDHTRRFPDIVAALRKLDANGLILDGEVAVYDAQLVSRFEWLRHASPPDLSTPPLFMVFDCLQARAVGVTSTRWPPHPVLLYQRSCGGTCGPTCVHWDDGWRPPRRAARRRGAAGGEGPSDWIPWFGVCLEFWEAGGSVTGRPA